MAANKRVRSRRPKNGRDLAHQSKARPPEQTAQHRRPPRDLQGEIHRLECFIAAAPRLSRQQKLARLDYVPPYQAETPVSRRQSARQLPLHQQSALRRRRLRLAAELGIVGVSIAGLAGWLNHCLQIFR